MTKRTHRFVLCISNAGYLASLEPRKVYEAVADPDAATEKLLRIIDESGEDYLFPETLFVAVELSGEAEAAILRVS